MESSELEDGEVCFSEDDDDQDLSYNIDERIEEVLGHFRKDFEGLVSAESLGPKYGGHGSFLPVDDQHFPISLEPKTPQKVEGCAVLGEKNTDTHDQKHSMGKEKENISASTFKKLQTATCSRKRKVGGDFAVDAAFSYDIDERIEKVLGHFRKDFEGLVSAESFGSKFGGYGSFFPVDQWDSPISCKGKTPQKKVGSVRCWPIQKGFSVLVNDCASTRGSREVFGEKNVDKSMAKEEENVSCSLKKHQTATCCQKRKVVGDVMVEAAFSYNIDERIEEVLGHFRTDFEGLVSAESLGSKFGGYGSFFPVDQWDSPISCKGKTPQKKVGSVRCWPIQKRFSVLVNDCASTRVSREVFGEKNVDKSMAKERENVSCSLKKQQTTACCKKRKVASDVIVEAAFSYNIDERIEKVLGHFRKDFEGLVSSKNLGSKFGKYCSFLPLVWHSSISCKPKSPNKVDGCAVLGEKSIDTDDQKSIGEEEEEEENVSVSTLKKKLQTTCRCRKRKVDDVVVEAAFSYNIDERIEKVLGHFRKDFEGLVSAESLGPKFGRYGSFLPVDYHFPSSRKLKSEN